MRALLISKVGRDIMTLMNFLVKIGYSPHDIIVIMDTKQSISYWWLWMIGAKSTTDKSLDLENPERPFDEVKSFVYIDPHINDLSFSNEPFTPAQLRELINNTPMGQIINIFIASTEVFDMYPREEILVITGKIDIAYSIPTLQGLTHSDISNLCGLNISGNQILLDTLNTSPHLSGSYVQNSVGRVLPLAGKTQIEKYFYM